jgi:(p)ppGpp synthase/HD superfamily hydrolase
MVKNWSQETYIKGYRFAAYAHRNQTVPGSDFPYIMHISFVTMEVIAAINLESERDGDLAIQCALLHDVIEDTDTSFDQIAREFGEAVAKGVLALTKDKTLARHLQMSDSLKRIQQQPPEVWMVKMADRISNLQQPPDFWTKNKIAFYREEAIQIYETLKDASPVLSSRLASKIKDYQKFVCHLN